MRAVFTACLLALVTLAGCADSSGPEQDSDDFGDIEVDDTTGAIRGVVVDDSITPVPGANIELNLDGSKVGEATSDERGQFSFSKLPPGTYFLKVSKELFEEAQTSTTVEPGVKEPPVIKVQIPRLFEGAPYTSPVDFKGFFTCSQANFPGYLYASSPCHANNWGGFVGDPAPSTDLDAYGFGLEQQRTFHSDVDDGWQTLVFEMTWEPSARGTSERMGMVVSTYKPERDGAHSFANVGSGSPMRFQLDVGEPGPGVGSAEPMVIPPEGIKDMSYFVSVRPPEGSECFIWCVPPGLAVDQDFHVYLTQFYYLPAPEDWSIVAGDQRPF